MNGLRSSAMRTFLNRSQPDMQEINTANEIVNATVKKLEKKKNTPQRYRISTRSVGAVITVDLPAELYNKKTMGEINAVKKTISNELRSVQFHEAIKETVEKRLKDNDYVVRVFVDPLARVTINRRRWK